MLWTVHRIFIASAIALCLAYAAYELTHGGSHPPVRVAAGVAIPLVVAGGLVAYLVHLIRRR